MTGGDASAAPVPAIVLTCDRYHPLTEHMILRYGVEWPSHPFTFHVPYQARALAGPRIEPRRTPEAIRATVLELLAPFDDEAWIYWSIDDKYPVQLVQPSVAQLAAALLSEQATAVDGVLFCRCRKLLLPEYLRDGDRRALGGMTLLRRRDYSQIWIHQFLRVKVLRYLFMHMPARIPLAKAMDGLLSRIALPPDHRLYVVETNLAVFGESTTRGRVTRNCAESLKAHGFAFPAGFDEARDRVLVMGEVDSCPRSAPSASGVEHAR